MSIVFSKIFSYKKSVLLFLSTSATQYFFKQGLKTKSMRVSKARPIAYDQISVDSILLTHGDSNDINFNNFYWPCRR